MNIRLKGETNTLSSLHMRVAGPKSSIPFIKIHRKMGNISSGYVQLFSICGTPPLNMDKNKVGKCCFLSLYETLLGSIENTSKNDAIYCIILLSKYYI